MRVGVRGRARVRVRVRVTVAELQPVECELDTHRLGPVGAAGLDEQIVHVVVVATPVQGEAQMCEWLGLG